MGTTAQRVLILSITCAMAIPAIVGALSMTALFPEGGIFGFVGRVFWPLVIACALSAVVLSQSARPIKFTIGVYLLILFATFVVSNPVGQNASRLGATLGPAILVLGYVKADRRVLALCCGVVLLFLQWQPAVRAAVDAQGDPSAAPAFHQELIDYLDKRLKPGRTRRDSVHKEPLGSNLRRAQTASGSRLGAASRPQGQPNFL